MTYPYQHSWYSRLKGHDIRRQETFASGSTLPRRSRFVVGTGLRVRDLGPEYDRIKIDIDDTFAFAEGHTLENSTGGYMFTASPPFVQPLESSSIGFRLSITEQRISDGATSVYRFLGRFIKGSADAISASLTESRTIVDNTGKELSIDIGTSGSIFFISGNVSNTSESLYRAFISTVDSDPTALPFNAEYPSYPPTGRNVSLSWTPGPLGKTFVDENGIVLTKRSNIEFGSTLGIEPSGDQLVISNRGILAADTNIASVIVSGSREADILSVSFPGVSGTFGLRGNITYGDPSDITSWGRIDIGGYIVNPDLTGTASAGEATLWPVIESSKDDILTFSSSFVDGGITLSVSQSNGGNVTYTRFNSVVALEWMRE